MPNGPITAVICTRDRCEALAIAVRSVLASQHPDFQLLVVDQSRDSSSWHALAEFVGDPRLRYVVDSAVGVSRARNLALREAATEFVAFTDDDCEVPSGWLATMHDVLQENRHVVQAFCAVRAGPHDRETEFVPSYQCIGTRIVRTLREKRTARGMGAGMAVRAPDVLALGGFDEALGPGATFPSCEEGDLAVRAILRGHAICETDRTFVIHHGVRTWAEGKYLSRRDWLGIGAAYAKPLRVGAWRIAVVIAYEFGAKAMAPALLDLAHLQRPRGLGRGLHMMRGLAQGFLTPMDKERLLFAQGYRPAHPHRLSDRSKSASSVPSAPPPPYSAQ